MCIRDRRRTDHGGEILEEIVGDLFGGAVHQPLAELGKLAANLGLNIVGEQRTAVLLGQRDACLLYTSRCV